MGENSYLKDKFRADRLKNISGMFMVMITMVMINL